MMQVNNLEQLLAWVKSSPCQFTVSSMSGGYVHVKFLVPCDERVKSTDPDQVYTDDRGVRWRKEDRDEEITRTRCYNTLELHGRYEDRDALMNRCYEDGFKDGEKKGAQESYDALVKGDL
jgi:hypothetical protein